MTAPAYSSALLRLLKSATADTELGARDGLLRTRDAALLAGLPSPAAFRSLAAKLGLEPADTRLLERSGVFVHEHLWTLEQVEQVRASPEAEKARGRARRRLERLAARNAALLEELVAVLAAPASTSATEETCTPADEP